MSKPFIPEDMIASEKLRYAEALRAYRLQNPFDREAPFKAALMLWPEESGKLPIALWVVHSERWHECEDVAAAIQELNEDAAEAAEEEQMYRIRNKEAGKESILLRLYTRLDLETDSDKLVKIAAEIAKYQGLHEKPDADPNEGRILGIIQHELKPVDATGAVIPFADRVREQQQRLQRDIAAHEITLDGGEDARLIN